jgi:hypothetical protein
VKIDLNKQLIVEGVIKSVHNHLLHQQTNAGFNQHTPSNARQLSKSGLRNIFMGQKAVESHQRRQHHNAAKANLKSGFLEKTSNKLTKTNDILGNLAALNS